MLSWFVDIGCTPCKRAMWVIIDCQGYKFGICSLYFGNGYYRGRIEVGSQLVSNLPKVPWILGGEFSVNKEDKSGARDVEFVNL